MGVVMWGLLYFFYETNIKWEYVSLEKYNKELIIAKAYVPEIIYKERKYWTIPWFWFGDKKDIISKLSFHDWFDIQEEFYNLPYFRVMNKDYLVTNWWPNWYLENQLSINFLTLAINEERNAKYFNKSTFEEELKKYTDKKFTILNIWNVNQHSWVIDFDSKILKNEIDYIESNIVKNLYFLDNPRSTLPPIRIKYNSVLLPEFFNDKGFIDEMNNNYNLDI